MDSNTAISCLRYKELNDLYWSNRSIAQALALDRYQSHLKYMRRYCSLTYFIPHNPVEALITLLFLPLLIPCGIYLNHQQKLAKAECEQCKEEQWLRDMTYKAARVSLRNALHEQDLKAGTNFLKTMDSMVKELGVYAQNEVLAVVTSAQSTPSRFATLEEIYDRLYEPSFQTYQAGKRPCRRYHGTYLEQIREGQHQSAKARQQSKNTKRRKTSEAIEIVFSIGHMDNTGYANSPRDAQCSAELLGDFCDHLMQQSNLCCVTTKELNDPTWQPPFRNGLIVLNLTVHADEATPGVHLSCIPYSRNCKRGPKVQASMGKALSGMGYPSTWRPTLDENGNPVPKKDKEGKIIFNKDGSMRYQQEPDKQGIIDWIEEQKCWIQVEMKKRYNWEREYKGDHSRGHLVTLDYQAARARERQEEYNALLYTSIQEYEDRIYELSVQLDERVTARWENAANQDIIERYLAVCPDSTYDAIVETASAYLDQLAANEKESVRQDLLAQIRKADEKREKGSSGMDQTAEKKHIYRSIFK